MSAGQVPPSCPAPIFGKVSHHSMEVDWTEFMIRLKEVFDQKVDGRLLVECQRKLTNREDWETVYSGYDKKITCGNLDPESTYDFRIRFKNKHGWGGFSEIGSLATTKPPLTGQDLHKAIRISDEIHLEKLLEKGEADIEATDNLGFTPLMAACNKGDPNIVKILINAGAYLETKNDSGKTALMMASIKGHADAIGILLEHGADINNCDKSGLCALHCAVDGEQLRALRTLLTAGADVNMAETGIGWTPLLRCAGLKNNGNILVAGELIKFKATVDTQDKEGKSALHNAILNGHAKLVDLLLQHGANLELKTNTGHSAKSLADCTENRAVKMAISDFYEKQSEING